MNSELNNSDDMLNLAREHFKQNQYSQVEPLLNQLILRNAKSPEVFHMLGTIYYDQGKFNKAIRAFRRALEIDPAFTDASVGLSIILNDLGKYEEGKKVFEEAKVLLQARNTPQDPYVNEKLAIKHDELGELYFQYQRHKDALEQYYKALNLSSRKPELTMKIVDCYSHLNDASRAIKELKELIKEYPGFISARVKLGRIYYEGGDLAEAVEQWEAVIQLEPNHAETQRLLRQVQAVTDRSLMPAPSASL